MLREAERKVFDTLLAAHIDRLPEDIADKLDEVPVIVEDEPTEELLRELGMNPDEDDLCGLHSGIALTDRSVEHSGQEPDHIQLFRGPIIRLADWSLRRDTPATRAELARQIQVTLLHEIGHHFGLDEDDLEALGYD
jgi:predicted Zn-dependent protease with MMP-like domain